MHCPIADKCVENYEGYSRFAVNSIGQNNHPMYFAFMFFLWLDTFLVGFIDARSVTVTECDLPDDDQGNP